MVTSYAHQEDDRRSRLLAALPAIAWSASAHTFRFTYINSAAERLLGYPVERWLEEPNFWLDHIHPDDRHVAQFCHDETLCVATTSSSIAWSPPTAAASGCVTMSRSTPSTA